MIKEEDIKPGVLVKFDGVASFNTGEPILVVSYSVESVSGFRYFSEEYDSCIFVIDRIEDDYVYVTPIGKIYRDKHLDTPIDVMNMHLQLFMRNARIFKPRGSLLPPILPSLDGSLKTGVLEETVNKLNKAGEAMFNEISKENEAQRIADTLNQNREELKKQSEQVSHPSHYSWLKDLCGVEPLDICRHLDFNVGNAIKYLLRKDKVDGNKTKKEKRIEDLNKAKFYIEDEIKLLEHGKD